MLHGHIVIGVVAMYNSEDIENTALAYGVRSNEWEYSRVWRHAISTSVSIMFLTSKKMYNFDHLHLVLVWGQTSVKSHSGAIYFISFIDNLFQEDLCILHEA